MKEMLSLQQDLQSIPISGFIGSDEKAQILRVFKLRMVDPDRSFTEEERVRVRIALLQDIPFTAHLLDPQQNPDNDAPFQMRLHGHIYSYCQ